MAGGERALKCGASGAPQSRRHERHWSSSSGRAAEAMSASRSGRNTCWCFVAEEMRRCARGDWAVPRVHLASLRRHHTAPTAHSSCQHTTNTPLSCQPVPVAHRACWGARQRSEPLLSVPWICSRRACHVGRQRAHHCGERCEGLKPGASGTLGMPKSAERLNEVIPVAQLCPGVSAPRAAACLFNPWRSTRVTSAAQSVLAEPPRSRPMLEAPASASAPQQQSDRRLQNCRRLSTCST